MARTKNRKLSFKSLGWLSAINIGIAIVGVLQTVVIARIFGVSRTVEVYFASTTFQAMLMRMSSTGRMADLFTPIFHDIQFLHGKEAGRNAFAAMTNVMILGSIVVAAAAAFWALPIAKLLVPGFANDEIALCARIFLLTSPLFVIQVMNSMLSNLLQAEHHYGVIESLTLISRLFNVFILLIFGSTLGIWALVIGLWAAGIIQWLGQIIYSWQKGYRHRLRFSSDEFHPRTVLIKIPFTFTHIFSAQFFVFALTASMSSLPEGTYGIYNYARRLTTKFEGLILRPVGIIFFNRFSHALAEGADRVRDYAHHALALSCAIVTLAIVPIICGGDYLLMGMWGGEKYSIRQIQDTHLVLIVLTFLLFVNAQYLIARRTNLAIKVVVRQFAASGLVLVVAGIACYLVIPKFGLWGAVLLDALSVIGTTIATVGVLWLANRELVAIFPFGKSVAWLFSGSVAVMGTIGLRQVFSVGLEADRLYLYMAACAYGLFSVAVCATVSWLLGIPESKDIIKKAGNRLGQLRARYAH